MLSLVLKGDFDMLGDLVIKNRSFRRFDESYQIEREVLEGLVDLGRLSASGANLQPLKYYLCCDKAGNDVIFPFLAWAGYLCNWPGAKEGERPSAYIIILCDTNISKNCGCDHGIAAQSILLGAAELGLGGCMIGSIKKAQLAEKLELPEHLEIALVLALGKPAEKVVLEDIDAEGSIKYYRDAEMVHHVPKRSLKDIIVR